jgi:hypothetical protein
MRSLPILVGVVLATAIVLYGLMTRYECFANTSELEVALVLDRMTGRVYIYDATDNRWLELAGRSCF